MKPCAYCGLENEDETAFCKGCGTEIVASVAEQAPGKPLETSGLKNVLLTASALVAVMLLYLLSFGPVARWTGTTAIPAPLFTVTNGTSFTMVYTTSYPAWVGVVYYPAFELLASGAGGGLSELYVRYMHWWEKSPTGAR